MRPADDRATELFRKERAGALMGQQLHDADSRPAEESVFDKADLDRRAFDKLAFEEIEPGDDADILRTIEERLPGAGKRPETDLTLEPPEEDVAPEDIIIRNGMSMRDFEALATKAANEAARYEQASQRSFEEQYVAERGVDRELAAGMHGDLQGAPSRFEAAEQQGKQAENKNDEGYARRAQSDQMRGLEETAERVLATATPPAGPRGPMGA